MAWIDKENKINKINPLISVIIPCRNEEKFIGACLNSLLTQDYAKDKIEIIVVDGMSEDDTRDKIQETRLRQGFGGQARNKYPNANIQVLDNPNKITPLAMNIGIKNARGDLITKTDAHSIYPKNYLSTCVEYLKKYNADAVGGIAKATPEINTLTAKAIAVSLSSKFGVGGAGFRAGVKKPEWADTAFGACYKKEVFEKLGLFNENLLGSQDIEFNLRLKKAGGKLLLAPDIVIEYHPKPTLGEFFKHNIRDGVWAILPLKFTKMPFRLKHYIPLIFILTLPLSIWPYIPVNLFFSAKIAAQEKNWRLFFILPPVFAARHFGYGIGSVLGLIKLVWKNEN